MHPAVVAENAYPDTDLARLGDPEHLIHQFVTGEVRLTLEPGRCYPSGRRAEKGLYDYELATYDAADAFRHEDAAGFVRLWGLSVETVARREGGL